MPNRVVVLTPTATATGTRTWPITESIPSASAVVFLSGAQQTMASGSTLTIATGATLTVFGTSVTTKTGTGALVLATSPTLITPALGTPSSGTLTSCTGYVVGNIAGLGTNVATALGVNVGSAGAFVVLGGALGTPSSGTLTNCTGLPLSTGNAGVAIMALTADAADITTNTTPSDVTGLTFSVGANETWAFSFEVYVTAASVTPQFKYTVNSTQTPTAVFFLTLNDDGGGQYETESRKTSFGSTQSTTTSSSNCLRVLGCVVNGATPATISFQLAQVTSSADAIRAKAASSGIAFRK